jgi:hypothetical protein
MESEQNPILENTRRLEKLYKYLNYEISSSIVYLASWLFAIFLPLLFLAAILFTPFMLFVLYKEEKKGWIISFAVIIIAPTFLSIIIFPALTILGLIPFYFYCFILRLEVKSWLQEIRARNELILRKIRNSNESNEFEDIFDIRN